MNLRAAFNALLFIFIQGHNSPVRLSHSFFNNIYLSIYYILSTVRQNLSSSCPQSPPGGGRNYRRMCNNHKSPTIALRGATAFITSKRLWPRSFSH